VVLLGPQQETSTAATASALAPKSTGDIGLTVQHDGAALRLRWNPRRAGIQDAATGTLTITDGGHESTLHLDGPELRAGLASYWPDGDRVRFRLDTDTGASGAIDVPVESGRPQPAPEAVQAATAPVPARRRAAAPARRARPAPAALDDGLEWTRPESAGPAHRDSRWSRLKHKLPFWKNR
jgi:hypothetical protein